MKYVAKPYSHLIWRILFTVLATVSLLATLLPFLPIDEWFIRVFDYPRLQTFFLALIALLWFYIFYFKRRKRGYGLLLMFGVVVLIQGYKALAYTPLGAKQVLPSEAGPADTTHISLMIANVLQTNTEYHRLLAAVEQYQPDLLLTTESDARWQVALKPLEGSYPFRVAIPLSNTYGMHLYSRRPLADTQVRYLLEPDIPSIRTRLQLGSGEWVTLFAVHPRPPVPGESNDSRERDAEIIMVAQEARKVEGGVMVAGDFNDVAWSKTTALFQEVSGLLDPRRGRGFYNTFHAKYPIFRWPLDHIFISSHFKLVSMERTKSIGSDHFPIYVKLSYEPEEKSEQPEVEADDTTEAEAHETIREGVEDEDAPGE